MSSNIFITNTLLIPHLVITIVITTIIFIGIMRMRMRMRVVSTWIPSKTILIFFCSLHAICCFHSKYPSSNKIHVSSKVSKYSGIKFTSNIETSTSCAKELNILKQNENITKWQSSVSYIRPMSSVELFQLTRQSFSSPTYFEDLLQSMDNNYLQNSLINAYVVSSIIIILVGVFIVPTLDIPTFTKNTIGLICLIYPFVTALIGYFRPDFFTIIIKIIFNKFQGDIESKSKERIMYHEAGHILVGYLCGIAVKSYSIDDDVSSHAAVDIDPDFFVAKLNTDLDKKQQSITIGNLLMVAMAGVVAETLRFGDSKGGGKDLYMAKSLLDISQVSSTEMNGYLRWSVGKCLSLLRLNRNALDELVTSIKMREDIRRCYEVIESTVD